MSSSDKRARRAKRAQKSRKQRSGAQHDSVRFLHSTAERDRLLQAFGVWLVETNVEHDPEQCNMVVDVAAGAMAELSELHRGTFSETAWTEADIEAALSYAREVDEDDAVKQAATVLMALSLRMFLDFLEDTGRWTGTSEAWERVLSVAETRLVDDVPELQVQIEDVDPAIEEAVLDGLGVAGRLRSLLDWIGRQRPVTGAGWLKPALVPELARVLDFDMSAEPSRMSDHNGLAELWMQARQLELIEVTSTQARPGPKMHQWRSGPRLELLREAATLDLDATLTGRTRYMPVEAAEMIRSYLYHGITGTPLAPNAFEEIGQQLEVLDPQLTSVIRRRLDELIDEGWLRENGEGYYEVPMALRPVVAELLTGEDDPAPLGDPVPPGTMTVRMEMPYIDPPVWRRIEVSSQLRLIDMHIVIQSLMSWNEGHLHQFTYRDKRGIVRFGPGQAFEMGAGLSADVIAEDGVSVGTLLTRPGDELLYEYDFGDGWQVRLVLEAVSPADDMLVRVTDGGGMAPLDDVGGPGGWAYFIEAVTNPAHPDHQDRREWGGLSPTESFDPTFFDPVAADRVLQRLTP